MPVTVVGQLESSYVAGNQEIAPGLFRLSFPRTFDFTPGQAIALTTDRAIPPRFYSIASGRGEPLAEVLYDVVPGGQLTPRLARLRPGQALLVSPPFGSFADGEGASYWIAGGTGIAPFLSMIRSGTVREKTLVHGSSTLAGLVYREMLCSTSGCAYHPCCSRERSDSAFPGRPTEWLTEHHLPAVRYLLCGGSRMVVDAREVIIGKGIPFESVIAEIYF